jgi:hypothetical protein
MSTLHINHWQGIDFLNSHLNTILNDDSLLIFGDLSPTELVKLNALLENNNGSCYLVFDDDCPHNAIQAIDHDQWLALINQHDNSFAWK